ncbi:hypothetical protein [Dyadobacter luticola]|uniref:DUF5666 domain-containing protein n=1 Tax=Dyadobacter luticola TaxID=1979387 RepID=A0A5R9KZ67_9BACT|nr:hypothetical protein [Dyadobacter luticola]TLV01448.1 hypothetical protein FEN17_18640 [Dyadobacter luticola]
MKTVMMAAAMMTAIMLSSGIQAQPGNVQGPDRIAGGAPGPGRPGPVGPRPGGPGPGGPIGGPGIAGGLQPVNAYQGKVVKLQYNDDFTFDGFYILNSIDSVLVKFPAHLGKQVMSAAKVGSNVNFTGTMEATPFGASEVRLVSLNDKMLNDSPQTELPPAEKFVDGKAKVASLQKGRDGMVTGLILDNKTLLKLPPHVMAQMGNSLQPGSAIVYSGNQKSVNAGEISLDNYVIVRPNTLTINGQQYLVR